MGNTDDLPPVDGLAADRAMEAATEKGGEGLGRSGLAVSRAMEAAKEKGGEGLGSSGLAGAALADSGLAAGRASQRGTTLAGSGLAAGRASQGGPALPSSGLGSARLVAGRGRQGHKQDVVSQVHEQSYGADPVQRTVAAAGQSSQATDGGDDHNDLMGRFDCNFKLAIKLLGNIRTRRKDVKCFSFEMDVDSDRTNLKDLVESVVEKYPPGYLEVAHIQYYDEALKTFPEIKSDQDLMCLFSKHRKMKAIFMFIIYRGPSDPYEPVTKWDFDEDSIELDEDDYLRNPAPQNEHVGVHEEAMYLESEPQTTHWILNYPIEKEKDPATVDDSEDGNESDDDGEDEDEEEEAEDGEAEEDDDEVHEEDEDPCTDGNNALNVVVCDTEDPPSISHNLCRPSLQRR